MFACRPLPGLRIVDVPDRSGRVIHILTEGHVVIVSPDALVVRDLIEVVDVLVDAQLALTRVDDLDLLENLDANLSAHHCVGFLVCQFASKQEPCLAELIEQCSEGKAIVYVLLDLRELGKFLNGLLEEYLIFIGNSEVLDELRNSENFQCLRPVRC